DRGKPATGLGPMSLSAGREEDSSSVGLSLLVARPATKHGRDAKLLPHAALGTTATPAFRWRRDAIFPCAPAWPPCLLHRGADDSVGRPSRGTLPHSFVCGYLHFFEFPGPFSLTLAPGAGLIVTLLTPIVKR